MYTSIDTSILSGCRQPAAQRLGFTLIELLAVIGIIVILYGMLSVMLSVAQRQGRLANTRATMMKVDQAIRLFRTDMRIYPWQSDVGTAPTEPAAWSNDLAWRLAWNPPPVGSGTASDPDRLTYLRGFHADVSAIQQRFRFVNGRNVPPSGDASEGTHAFRNEAQTASSRTNLMVGAGSLQETIANLAFYSGRWIPGTTVLGNDCAGDALALTRMAQEVTTLAYTAGQLPTQAPTGIDATLPEDKARFPFEDERYPLMKIGALPFRYHPYNKVGHYGDDRRGPALASAAARARGWRGDYLEIATRKAPASGRRVDVDAGGEAIVDAWGHPLIYICAVRPGIHGYMPALSTSIFNGAREDRYNMGPQGRAETTALASDIRTTAGSAYVLEFELWSAGPDGRFAALRSDPVNRDNLAVLPYTRGLQ